MGDSGSFDPNEAAGEIAKGLASSELVNNLLGPLTRNVGSTLGVVSAIAHFYTEENLAKIFTKWAKQRQGPPLDAEDFKRVLPLLRDAAMQSDDELQERWASLLENVASRAEGVLPSFGQTLSQLTPVEARYLDRYWKYVTAPRGYNSEKRLGRDELSFFALKDIYDPMLKAPSPGVMRAYRERLSPEQVAAFEEMTNFELMIHDLERLSILEKLVRYVAGDPTKFEIGDEVVSIPSENRGLSISYALTQYGVNFVRAVRKKHPDED